MFPFLRPTRFLQQSLTTASTAKAVSASPSCRRSFTCTPVSESTSGYGDADQTGDDPSNKPNLQGSRPRIDTEHPGREPVDEGKGTGSGGYAETGEKKGGGREGTGGNRKSESIAERKGKGNTKARKGGEMGVKLVSDMEDTMPDEGEKGDVERHNREMDQRYGHKEGEEGDEKVEKGFWSGESGLRS
ncbi:hypothetical protein Q9L58_006747 [Maublancomyces gigas]|uniref:Uncharacterized protein n=1 Tax=Discina gigas TaxID=1032678 RepID=A0ABR3GEX4_9PEZI